jgi:hypothetical protein
LNEDHRPRTKAQFDGTEEDFGGYEFKSKLRDFVYGLESYSGSGPLLGPLLSFISYFFGRTRVHWRRARLRYSPRGAQFFERALVEQVLPAHQAVGGLPYLVHQHHRQG